MQRVRGIVKPDVNALGPGLIECVARQILSDMKPAADERVQRTVDTHIIESSHSLLPDQ